MIRASDYSATPVLGLNLSWILELFSMDLILTLSTNIIIQETNCNFIIVSLSRAYNKTSVVRDSVLLQCITGMKMGHRILENSIHVHVNHCICKTCRPFLHKCCSKLVISFMARKSVKNLTEALEVYDLLSQRVIMLVSRNTVAQISTSVLKVPLQCRITWFSGHSNDHYRLPEYNIVSWKHLIQEHDRTPSRISSGFLSHCEWKKAMDEALFHISNNLHYTHCDIMERISLKHFEHTITFLN